MSGLSDLIAASAESLISEDLRLRSGATWNIGWVLYDSDGVLVDLTGGTASMIIKDHAGTTLWTFTHTLTSGRQIVLGNGSAAIQSTSVGSALASSSNFDGVYNLMVTKSGSTLSLASGTIRIYA